MECARLRIFDQNLHRSAAKRFGMEERMPEMILAAVPYFIIGLGSGMIVILRTCQVKIAQWKFQAVYWGKVLLINFFLQTIGKYYYGGALFYGIAETAAAALWVAALPVWLRYSCRDDVTKALCMVWLGDCASLVGTAAAGLLASASVRSLGTRVINTPGIHTLSTMVFGALWLFMLSYAGKGVFSKLRQWEIRRKKLVWLCFAAYFLLAAGISARTSLKDGTVLLASYGAACLVGLAAMAGVLLYLRREQKRLFKENQNLLLQRRLMEGYYHTLQEQMELTRKLRHDIANHIQTLEELMCSGAPQGEQAKRIAGYALWLRGQFQSLQETVYCQDPLVNAVISNKVRRCRQEKIRTEIRILSFEYGQIPDYEMTSILFNLFDNGIEGCRGADPERERFLELVCDNKASWLMIRMRNSSGKVLLEGKRPQTAKKGNHGLGLSIIEDIVRKYNGTWEYQISEGIFEIRLALETGSGPETR